MIARHLSVIGVNRLQVSFTVQQLLKVLAIMCGIVNISVTIVFGVFFLGLAYILRSQYPDDINQPWSKTFRNAMFQTIDFTSQTIDVLGLGSGLNFTRYIGSAGKKLEHMLSVNSSTVDVYNTKIAGVDVRIFTPKDITPPLPGLIYFPGGGWFLCNPEHYEELTVALSEELKAVVISVNYRKAPEHVYPAAFDDSLSVTKYVLKHPDEFGMRKTEIGVAGDSAGGNLAAGVSLKLSNDAQSSIPPLMYSVLIYPVVQAIDLNLPSYQLYGEGPWILTRRFMGKSFAYYLLGDRSRDKDFVANNHITAEFKASKFFGFTNPDNLPPSFKSGYRSINDGPRDGNHTLFKEIEHIITDPYFSPLIAPNSFLEHLPPTYVVTAEVDVLRDEGILYAQRLEEARVHVRHDHVGNEEHGFLFVISTNPVAKEFVRNVTEFVKSLV